MAGSRPCPEDQGRSLPTGTYGWSLWLERKFFTTLGPVLLRAALAGFIDYAGLFPPASLDLTTTIANHERYARSKERWMLGRLVVPLARLDEAAVILARTPGERDWSVSALVNTADRLDAVPASIDRFRTRAAGGVIVGALEAALPDPAAVAQFAAAAPDDVERFIEVPLDGSRDAWLDAIAAAGCHVKVRTGGVTEDRFPSSTALAGLLDACARRDVPLKATAGLHHPIRSIYRLTDEPDSPSGVMHGFVNVLAAALVLRSGEGDERDAVRVLEARDPRQFTFAADAIGWDGRSFDAAACEDTRAHLLRSVGSCSLEEPITELRGLGWL
jgi:hypothetical protein